MGSSGGGLEEALILLYLLVDDAYRIVTFGGRLRQRGPEPKLSDVEVLTMGHCQLGTNCDSFA
jgi:hypothetical protein